MGQSTGAISFNTLDDDAGLDACHGRTSPVMWNGKLTDMYHYSVTLHAGLF
jgi:hypothetical protein